MSINLEPKPLVSIIVPAYNVGRYIKECILSITRQTYGNIEIIVVDDGSPDDTPQIIDGLAVTDKRIIPIHQQNAGVSSARNAGIKKSKGDYLIFVDGDDYIASDFVEYMLEIVDKTGGELCLSLNFFTKNGEAQVKKEIIKTLDAPTATALLLSPRIIVGSVNKIYKRSLLDQYDLKFQPHLFYGEGLYFYITFSQLCTKVGIGNKKVYYYRRNNYDSATTRFNIKSLINGNLSIEEIRKSLRFDDPSVNLMLDLHQCLFSMGAVVRIKANYKEKEFEKEYKEFGTYLHKNAPKLIFKHAVPFYRKALLIGTCISPSLMAWLDSIRRKRIVAMSVK